MECGPVRDSPLWMEPRPSLLRRPHEGPGEPACSWFFQECSVRAKSPEGPVVEAVKSYGVGRMTFLSFPLLREEQGQAKVAGAEAL